MSVAYADPDPTLAMMVIKTCSLTVKGPGFKDMPKIFTRGKYLAAATPMGYDNSWAMIPVTLTEGKRKKKNWFSPGMTIAQARPMIQARSLGRAS
jgi:hypothetical protein